MWSAGRRRCPSITLGIWIASRGSSESCRNYPGLQLAGNGLTGVGIPQCVRSGQQAAERIVRYLNADRATVS